MQSRPYFRSLHGLRGLASLLVAAYHFPLHSGVTAFSFIRGGWLAVDLFFVMSGFLMATLYGDVRSADGRVGFVLARIARLWPAHLAMLGALLALELAKAAAMLVVDLPESASPFAGHTALEYLLPNLTLTQSFIGIPFPTWNDPAWSVSAELGAYGWFIVLTLLPKRSQPVAWIAASALGLAGVMILSPTFMAAPINLGVLRCAAGFFLGCWLTQVPAPRLSSRTATLLEILAFSGAALFVAGASGRSTLLAPFVFGGVVLIFRSDAGALSRVLSTSPMRWLGDISYSLYLVHLPLLIAAYGGGTILGIGAPADGDSLLLLVCFLGVSVVAATILRAIVEVPGARLVKAWLSPRPRQAPGR